MGGNGKGSFTLPGEAGYEALTLRLAERWGADVIRDSDGTALSDEILSSGYGIYSTICLVRADNKWAKANPDKLQQNYLMSFPVTAAGPGVTINLLDGYFREQFAVNFKDDPKEWWQVFDRTAGLEVPASRWDFDASAGTVTVRGCAPWHRYTVNFLVFRIWEEISMYNHITNNWGDRERLMAVEPRYPETQAHLLALLDRWLADRPRTAVVRFTSMFYNFCWFWGGDPKLRFVYSDWGSYDFTVNPLAMRAFEKAKGYRMTSEDFVNAGRYNSTHNPPSKKNLDWMDFINEFVVSFGKKCVDLVHKHGKQAYVFYDDHWIGVEPWGERFAKIGFDGIIKCVFSGFEARLCAGVKAPSHELRLHPYLFPTGLGGEPTFKEGGDPARDAQRFWASVRRALLREPVDRIGLGGYPHLAEPFPDFMDRIESIADEFRLIKSLHANGKPHAAPFRVGVLTCWGRLRAWTCSGHMHEHPEVQLIQALESLAGLPVEVEFLSFDDVLERGVPGGVNVLVNAGRAGSAWSGGDAWKDPSLVEKLTAWAHAGGGFLGIGEPSAADTGAQWFQMGHALGVDRETGRTICNMKRSFSVQPGHFILMDAEAAPDFGGDTAGVFAACADTEVLSDADGSVRIAVHPFGAGRAAYFSGFRHSPANARLLHRALWWLAGMEDGFGEWACSNALTECAWFPGCRRLAVINNSELTQRTGVRGEMGELEVSLAPYELRVLDI